MVGVEGGWCGSTWSSTRTVFYTHASTHTRTNAHTQVHMRHIRALARTRTCVHPTYRFESVSAYVDWVAGGVQEQVNSILIERERERERDRQTDRQTERER